MIPCLKPRRDQHKQAWARSDSPPRGTGGKATERRGQGARKRPPNRVGGTLTTDPPVPPDDGSTGPGESYLPGATRRTKPRPRRPAPNPTNPHHAEPAAAPAAHPEPAAHPTGAPAAQPARPPAQSPPPTHPTAPAARSSPPPSTRHSRKSAPRPGRDSRHLPTDRRAPDMPRTTRAGADLPPHAGSRCTATSSRPGNES